MAWMFNQGKSWILFFFCLDLLLWPILSICLLCFFFFFYRSNSQLAYIKIYSIWKQQPSRRQMTQSHRWSILSSTRTEGGEWFAILFSTPPLNEWYDSSSYLIFKWSIHILFYIELAHPFSLRRPPSWLSQYWSLQAIYRICFWTWQRCRENLAARLHITLMSKRMENLH